ncbi:MAG: hypothetical protein NT118_01870, partial [Lentisphaerae bacterium]|nr:hypothetical protein [Lentisphaerota bacterium]
MGMSLLNFDDSPAPELLPVPRSQTAMAVRESCDIRKRIEDVEDVPAKYRAKQQEMTKFTKMAVDDSRRSGKGLEEC